jgi:hypothetical protein
LSFFTIIHFHLLYIPCYIPWYFDIIVKWLQWSSKLINTLPYMLSMSHWCFADNYHFKGTLLQLKSKFLNVEFKALKASFFTLSFFFYILSFLHLLTCVHHLGHLLSPSALLSSDFVEKTWDTKKNIAFLQIWDENGYTERFLMLLPCTCVLQPTLVHLYQASSLHPGSLPRWPLPV